MFSAAGFRFLHRFTSPLSGPKGGQQVMVKEKTAEDVALHLVAFAECCHNTLAHHRLLVENMSDKKL